jgi:hypothetical protein
MPIEVCLSIPDSDSELPLLRDNGWRLVSPRERVGDADSYRRYIQRSRGEFSPRSAHLLAGKKWLVQRPQRLLPGRRAASGDLLPRTAMAFQRDQDAREIARPGEGFYMG